MALVDLVWPFMVVIWSGNGRLLVTWTLIRYICILMCFFKVIYLLMQEMQPWIYTPNELSLNIIENIKRMSSEKKVCEMTHNVIFNVFCVVSRSFFPSQGWEKQGHSHKEFVKLLIKALSIIYSRQGVGNLWPPRSKCFLTLYSIGYF